MPRRLIRIPSPKRRLRGAVEIEPGYPRPYTPAEMRSWADDLSRYDATSDAEIQRLRVASPDELNADERRLRAIDANLFTDPSCGINGWLGRDGTIELDKGRHRAAYMLDRGVETIPVWVTAPDERELDALEARCTRERSASHGRPPSAGTARRATKTRRVYARSTRRGTTVNEREPQPDWRNGDVLRPTEATPGRTQPASHKRTRDEIAADLGRVATDGARQQDQRDRVAAELGRQALRHDRPPREARAERSTDRSRPAERDERSR